MNTDTISQILELSIGSLSVEKLFYILLLTLLCYIVSKILLKIFKRIIQQFSPDRSIQVFLNNGLKILLIFISIIIITEYLGIPTTSLVALLSVASLAISLSVQGLLSNVAGGLTILFTRPFAVGDYIELDSLSGKVTQTGLIYTQLLTPENKTVFLPNSQVSEGRIINYTSQTQRRIEIFVGASYNAPVEDVKEANNKFVHDNKTGKKCPNCNKYLLEVKGKNGIMNVCQDRECGYRESVARVTNARCPECKKKLGGMEKGKFIFVLELIAILGKRQLYLKRDLIKKEKLIKEKLKE